jgi:hypothetical protein
MAPQVLSRPLTFQAQTWHAYVPICPVWASFFIRTNTIEEHIHTAGGKRYGCVPRWSRPFDREASLQTWVALRIVDVRIGKDSLLLIQPPDTWEAAAHQAETARAT